MRESVILSLIQLQTSSLVAWGTVINYNKFIHMYSLAENQYLLLGLPWLKLRYVTFIENMYVME